MPELISKEDAKAKGLRTFYTGKPCGHGHLCGRYVNSGMCSTCAIDRAKRYQAANPKKVRSYWDRPDVRSRNRAYQKEYRLRPGVYERIRDYKTRYHIHRAYLL